jgi:hypothetical protein
VLNDCEQIFCMDGYTLTSQGCINTEGFNHTDNQPIKTPPTEIKIELTVIHKYCLILVGFNDTANCTHSLIMDLDNFQNEFKTAIAQELKINLDRIDNLTLIQQNKKQDTLLIDQTEDPIKDDDQHPKQDTFIVKSELSKLSFLIKDQKKFTDEKLETISLFYLLSNMAMEYTPLLVLNHRVLISDVKEVETPAFASWCNTNNDKKIFVNSNFRVLASFDETKKPIYFIYLSETETIYKTGDFYLTIAYSPTSSNFNLTSQTLFNMNSFRRKKRSSSDYSSPKIARLNAINWDSETGRLLSEKDISIIENLNKTFLSLHDITDYIFETNTTKEVYTQKYLTVCERHPKIRIKCLNLKTVRVRICELDYWTKNRSYCVSPLNECYSINQYEYDREKPNEYIRVCKYKNEQDLNKSLDLNLKLNEVKKQSSDAILTTIDGYVTFFSILISLIALIATLITYILFKQLRNLPAWNIINLVVALFLAQFSFLVGSLVSANPIFCFIQSIFSHYGFLAAFFWMNIIAFDLHRNFRKSNSNLMLKTISLKERLPKYLAYGWLSPLFIVLVSLIIDFSVKLSMDDSFFRPCYAGYLNGCVSYRRILFNDSQLDESFVYNKTESNDDDDDDLNRNGTFNQISSCSRQLFLVKILSSTCWIQNGFIFFFHFNFIYKKKLF